MNEKQFLLGYQIDQKFLSAVSELKPDIICDVGTRDCMDAIALKKHSPSSKVFAFEASPENFFDHCCTPDVTVAGVMPQLVAISDQTGFTEINIPPYASRKHGGNLQQRGMSSLLRKANTGAFVTYPVPQTTLDNFFEVPMQDDPQPRFAFWIDVEGLAFQVLNGMKKLLTRTVAIKIELEDVEAYENQTFSGISRELLEQAGFYEAYQSTDSSDQFDIIFLRREPLT
jgi:FkbM family methyltransferase